MTIERHLSKSISTVALITTVLLSAIFCMSFNSPLAAASPTGTIWGVRQGDSFTYTYDSSEGDHVIKYTINSVSNAGLSTTVIDSADGQTTTKNILITPGAYVYPVFMPLILPIYDSAISLEGYLRAKIDDLFENKVETSLSGSLTFMTAIGKTANTQYETHPEQRLYKANTNTGVITYANCYLNDRDTYTYITSVLQLIEVNGLDVDSGLSAIAFSGGSTSTPIPTVPTPTPFHIVDHYEFVGTIGDQIVGSPFNVTVVAKNLDGSTVAYTGPAKLYASSVTIDIDTYFTS